MEPARGQRVRALKTNNARLDELLAQAGIDAEGSGVATKLQRLLLAELHHRIKNMLAMVQAITIQSLRSAKSLDGARDAVQGRIGALARTHDLLLEANWDSAQFAPLLAAIVGPFDPGGRIAVSAPDFDVPRPTALSLAMALNELCTNAQKYGALSTPAGRVEVSGRVNAAGDTIDITWRESGGPVVQEPKERGFGTQLIEIMVTGNVRLDFAPAGVSCAMTMPLQP